MKIAEVGYVTSNRRLDFGADPDHDADTGIFRGIFTSDVWKRR